MQPVGVTPTTAAPAPAEPLLPIQENEVVEAGQRVVAVGSFGWCLTEGREYVVVDYYSEVRHDRFTFPPYIVVIGDHGRRVTCHMHRFRRAV